MTSPNHNTNTPSENTKREKATLNSFLQEIGIGETDFDPSSLVALKDILHGQEPQGFSDSSKRGKRTRETGGPLETISSNASDFAVKEGIGGNEPKDDPLRSITVPQDPVVTTSTLTNNNEDGLSFDIPPEATATERLILQQLRIQGSMLRNIQQRLNVQGEAVPLSAAADTIQRSSSFHSSVDRETLPRPPVVAPPPQAPQRAAPVQQQQPQPAAPNAAFPGVETYRRLAHLIHGIRTLYRNDGNNRRLFNAWLLIRVGIFASVILSRNQSKSPVLNGAFLWFVILGSTLLYLYEKPLRMAYIVGRRYGYRVLVQGERVDFTAADQDDDDDIAAVANVARNNDAPNNNNDAPNIWQRHFNNNIVLQWIYDFILLLGSFVFSIFPMWEPPRVEQQQHNDDMIPRVADPVDPAAREDDDDEID